MRLFVALPLADATRDALTAIQSGLPSARWTPAENLHLTLAFLGDVDRGDADALEDALGEIETEPFELRLAGVDAFASRREARLLYARVAEPAPVERLADEVRRAVRRAGLTLGSHERYRPHVTLARFRRTPPADLVGYLRQHALFRTAPEWVEAFEVCSSALHRDGATHTVEAMFPLGDDLSEPDEEYRERDGYRA